ncbi:MAG: S41 family peptidase [Pirellulaceae bacterium]
MNYVPRVFATLILAWAGTSLAWAQQPDDELTNEINFYRGHVFDQVSAHVEEHFFDPDFNIDEWKRQYAEFRRRAIVAPTRDEFAAIVNELLATLNASHTHYFSRLNPKRYQLLGVFHQLYDEDDESLFVYAGIGIDTRGVDGKSFITAAFDGFPAAQAGLQYGDEIVSVDGAPFHPVLCFAGKADTPVSVVVRRGGEEVTLEVPVQELDGRTMFERALEDSTRVIERNGARIGYLHAWSYAGSKYQEQIRAALLWGNLSDCDALILDLRDGWGGADLNSVNLFRPAIANIESATRDGDPQNYTGVWGKPVVLLTNGGSTSGKELFTFGFRKLGLGTVVGEKTAGAVVGGRAFLLTNGDLLYLAVTDVTVDGQRLEGVGVEPDITVPRPVQGADNLDVQLEAAIEVLAGGN